MSDYFNIFCNIDYYHKLYNHGNIINIENEYLQFSTQTTCDLSNIVTQMYSLDRRAHHRCKPSITENIGDFMENMVYSCSS